MLNTNHNILRSEGGDSKPHQPLPTNNFSLKYDDDIGREGGTEFQHVRLGPGQLKSGASA